MGAVFNRLKEETKKKESEVAALRAEGQRSSRDQQRLSREIAAHHVNSAKP